MDQEKKSKVITELEVANIGALVMGVGTKKGNRLYQTWRADKLDELETIKEKDLTVFERFKRGTGRKARTLFDKLAYLKKGK